jgi:hypothetical protein
MNNYKITGESRQSGAIGAFEPFIINTVSGCSAWAYKDVRAKLYQDGREHVHVKKIQLITDDGLIDVEPRAYL